ncbi:MAG: CoA-binding protein [Gemmatimonadetes bacterium]|nr:CoA-binding protein [Gemmatimonadota bacterium]
MAMTENLLPLAIDGDADLRTLLKESRRIAILGIKPDTHADRPAHFVASYLSAAGYDVIPVPVYYPDIREILGVPVHRSLSEIPGHVDLVVVFRRPEHVARHLDDLLAKRPRAVWFQSGIRNDQVARELMKKGIAVVQDRCMMVEHRRLLSGES